MPCHVGIVCLIVPSTSWRFFRFPVTDVYIFQIKPFFHLRCIYILEAVTWRTFSSALA
jgi:hypothetical protein